MIRSFKYNDKTFFIYKNNIITYLITDSIDLCLLMGATYLNYTYLGNSWYVGLFIVLSLIGGIMKLRMKKISKKELMEELE